jgi:hypothetical protein
MSTPGKTPTPRRFPAPTSPNRRYYGCAGMHRTRIMVLRRVVDRVARKSDKKGGPSLVPDRPSLLARGSRRLGVVRGLKQRAAATSHVRRRDPPSERGRAQARWRSRRLRGAAPGGRALRRKQRRRGPAARRRRAATAVHDARGGAARGPVPRSSSQSRFSHRRAVVASARTTVKHPVCRCYG